jgi:putative membrane protein
VSEPDLRILQANERTLLAWVRTGLALMAFGFVVARLAVWLELDHPERAERMASLLGIAVLVVGVACHAIGAVRFVRARRAIVAGKTIIPGATGPVVVAALVGAVGLGAIAYVLAVI